MKTNWRKYLLIPIFVCTVFFKSCQKLGTEKQPNILFAIADDWSWEHSSFLNFPEISTPAFDRIANEGVFFQKAYCSAPSCSPSRAAILTGMNGWELEQGAVLWGYLPAKFKLYPEILEENGYFIGYTGKGWGPGSLEKAGRKNNPAGKEFNKYRIELPENEQPGIRDFNYSENFKEFLEKKPKDKPFCFWFGSSEPHRPYSNGIGEKYGKDPNKIIVPEFLPDDSITRNDLLDYLFEIEWFDAHMGRMLKVLQEEGELENTMVVMTSDNGMPFPRAKSNLYDYGTHMPLAIMWKNKIIPGRIINDYVNLIDLTPTFLELAGVSIPKNISGKSLLPILLSEKNGQVDNSRNEVFTFKERHGWVRSGGEIYPMRAIQKEGFLLIWNLKPELWPAGSPDSMMNACNCPFGDADPGPTKSRILELAHKGDSIYYNLAFGKRPEFELYDVTNDPSQLKNLVNDSDYSSIFNNLKNRLTDYLNETKDPRLLGSDSIFVNTEYFGRNLNKQFNQ